MNDRINYYISSNSNTYVTSLLNKMFNMFVILCFIVSASAFKFGGPEFTTFVKDEQTRTIGNQDDLQGTHTIGGEDLTVTVSKTQDVFETFTNKFYNSVPILVTEFSKATVTLPTREVVRTPVDDMVRVQTQQITHFPVTETVTDIFSQHRLHTEISTDAFTVTNVDQNILQTTITSLVVKTFTFRPTIVRTVIDTELVRTTETEYSTSTIFEGLQTRRYY
ncbi:hypothetical protein Avbf_15865 [Armadillidium vulgare]|nr:hypothetical protein Avbf_15865 [Armadillidium vulgare]